MVLQEAPPHAPFQLRPYQRDCIERVLVAFQQCPRGGKALIVIPTGGGKTMIFTEIARHLGVTTLILAHRQELLQQAADKFRLVDPTAIIGQIGAGKHEWGAPVTVASVQTVSRPEHLKALTQFSYQFVVIDEAHHACAEAYRAVLRALPDAFVLGVTATPDRMDGQKIEAIFRAAIFSINILDLIKQGFLCDIKAIAIHTTASLDAIHLQDGDFRVHELEEAIDTPERNQRTVQAYRTHCEGRQALCFTVTIRHAENMVECFTRMGVRAAVVSGDTPSGERNQILHNYERGHIQVICNCGVLVEGFDAPQTSCIIMARPTHSRALYTQCVGRGLRLAPGKHDCIILDITDNCLKLRLNPQTLAQTLKIPLQDGESVKEAVKRQLQERTTKTDEEPQERVTTVIQRSQDLVVNILATMDWKRLPSGAYTLEIGAQKHRITLLPSETTDGYYSVWARLAPEYRMQRWLDDSPLSWAQDHAEMKAQLLKADETKRVLVDSNAPWRSKPVSLNQTLLLQQFGIPAKEDLTSGEASDLIGLALAQRRKIKEEKRAEKKKKTTSTKRARNRK